MVTFAYEHDADKVTVKYNTKDHFMQKLSSTHTDTHSWLTVLHSH